MKTLMNLLVSVWTMLLLVHLTGGVVAPGTGPTTTMGVPTQPFTSPSNTSTSSGPTTGPTMAGTPSPPPTTPPTCPPGYVSCPGSSGPCINQDQICDQVMDCPGGSDETLPECPSCPMGYIRCPGESDDSCIARTDLCDGSFSCSDGSDENICEGCPQGQVQCPGSNICIQNTQVCDNVQNCPTGIDEDEFLCSGERARLVLQLRETMINVTETDAGEESYVLVELDVLRNTLQRPLDLLVFFSSNAIEDLDYQISPCDGMSMSGSGSGISGSGSGISGSGSGISGSGSGISGFGSGMSGFGSSSGFISGFGSGRPGPGGPGPGFGSGFGSGLPPFRTVTIGPGTDLVCLNITIIGDDIIESEEAIGLFFGTRDDELRLSFVNENFVLVNIIDNDGAILTVPETVSIEEGDEQRVCVRIQNFYIPRERDVYITFFPDPSTPNIVFDVSINPSFVIIPVGESMTCVNIVALDDEFVEYNETGQIVAYPLNRNDVVNGSINVTVIDDDGVQLTVPEMVTVIEGGQQRVCVRIANYTAQRERNITVSFNNSDIVEAMIYPSMAVIPVGEIMACVDISVYDNDYVENDRTGVIIVYPENLNDAVNGSIYLTIIDNDGVDLAVPAMVEIKEGSTGSICVEISNTSVVVMRDVELSLMIGYLSDVGDNIELVVTNENIVIPPGDNMECFELTAVDDDVVEIDDRAVATVMAENPNDRVNGTTLIVLIDNDMARLEVSDGAVVIEEGQTELLCVNVSDIEQMRERNVTLDFTIEVGNNYTMYNQDFAITRGPFLLEPEELQACLEFAAIDDLTVEGVEIVTVTISADGEVVGNITVDITDNDGAVIAVPNQVSLNESDAYEYCVYVNGSVLERDVIYHFSVLPIGRFADEYDLVITSSPYIILSSQVSVGCVTLEAVDDENAEDTEVFYVVGTPMNPLDIDPEHSLVEVYDNDSVVIAVPEAISIMEGNEMMVCVNVSFDRERSVTLSFALMPDSPYADENDLVIVNDTVVTAEVEDSQACITVEAYDDIIVEGTEAVLVIVYSTNQFDVVEGNTTVYITDNDGALVLVPDMVRVMEGESVSICVQLSEEAERDVSLSLEVMIGGFSNYSDFLIGESNLTIPSGMNKTCFPFEAIDDLIVEDYEMFTVVFSATNPLDMINGTTTVVIADNDGAVLSISDRMDVMEGGEPATICVRINEETERDVPVMFTTELVSPFSSFTDFMATPLVMIPAGMDSACFQFQAIDDNIAEDTEMFNVTVEAVNTLDGVAVGTTTISIVDNDGVMLTVTEMLTVMEGEEGEQICVRVTDGQPEPERTITVLFPNVTFQTMYTDATDYELSADSAVINVDEMMSCITVTVVDDVWIEADESLVVVAMPYNPADKVDTNTTVTITDNDGAMVQLTNVTALSLIEGNSLYLCVEIVMEDQVLLQRNVTVNVTSYVSSSNDKATTLLQHDTALVFMRGAESATLLCTPVTIDIDLVYSVDRSFVVKFTPVNERDEVNGTDEVTITIIENGLRFLEIASLEGTERIVADETDFDTFSKPIYFRDGIPVGIDTQTVSYVGDNGVVSFNRGFLFWEPALFPTSDQDIRDSQVVAPFWSDVDIRRQGDIYYRLIEAGSSLTESDVALLDFVSGFVAARQPERANGFSATAMLVAQWMQVSPFPNGSDDELDPVQAEFARQRNSYQAVVVTDGVHSYTVFTYNCNMLEWSGLPLNAVIGVNVGLGIEGDFPPFENHPLSGLEQVTMVACTNQARGIDWVDLVYKIGDVSANELQRNRSRCMAAYLRDIEEFGDERPDLSPCPCSESQAKLDPTYTLNKMSSRSSVCYYTSSIFVKETQPETQECCYSTQGDLSGALLRESMSGEAGSLLRYHPELFNDEYLIYDEALRVSCCVNSDQCDLYYERRPTDDCSSYEPPNRCSGLGDPHIVSLDQRPYTFNGLGEYTIFRINGTNEREFEVQGRTELVTNSTATQFSSIAFGVPQDTYVEVRISESGEIEILLNSMDITNDTNSTTSTTVAITRPTMNRVESTFSNGISIIVTLQSGLLNYVAILPQSFQGQTQGLAGNFNGDNMDDFVYQNGTALSNDASDREIHYFGQSWEITQETSLFTYPDGLSAANFSFPDHTPRFLDEVLANASPEIIALCGNNSECIYDATETGNPSIGLETLETTEQNANDQMTASNNPPLLVGPTIFFVTIGELSEYRFNLSDDNSQVMPRVENGLPPNANLSNDGNNMYTLRLYLSASDLPTFNRTLQIVATDDLNATSLLTPQLQLCACDSQGGTCTLNGLIDVVANPLLLNCECGLAYTGRFCSEDIDGCTEINCFEGVECTDVEAPGVGATCGACPDGYFGDGIKCLDIDECLNDTSNNCQQVCVNTEGSFECECFPGHEPTSNTECRDIDECATLNGGCHQQCNNDVGNFSCACFEGFELQEDGINCIVLESSMCPAENPCDQNCVLLEGMPQCSCDMGFMLADDTTCLDVNECMADPRVCAQNCTNTNGSFMCGCSSRYTLGADGRSCDDIDECLAAALNGTMLCDPGMICNNTDGGYVCVCPTGTELFEGTCREICGMDFYRLENNRCAACPRSSVRPLSDPDSMCRCLPGYNRLIMSDAALPCLPTIGFEMASIVVQETDSPDYYVDLPLISSAPATRNTTLTFNTEPLTFASVVSGQVVFTVGSTMQTLRVRIEGNNVGTDGTRVFTININEGDDYLLSEGARYFNSIEVTIEEDDELPVAVEDNAVRITLADLTAETFTAERQRSFRMTTANAVNNYCTSQSCSLVNVPARRKRQSIAVTADDVIITDIMNNADGALTFSMFVQSDAQVVLSEEDLQDAIEDSRADYAQNGFVDLTVAPLVSPTTQPPEPSRVPGLSNGAIGGIVIGAILGAVLLALLVVAIVILIQRRKTSKSFVLRTYGFESKPRGLSLNRTDNGDTELNVYSQQPATVPLTASEPTEPETDEPMVSVQVSTIVERDEEEKGEIFSNEGATEAEKDTSLSDDIAKELAEETQVMNITFDEPGEETKL